MPGHPREVDIRLMIPPSYTPALWILISSNDNFTIQQQTETSVEDHLHLDILQPSYYCYVTIDDTYIKQSHNVRLIRINELDEQLLLALLQPLWQLPHHGLSHGYRCQPIFHQRTRRDLRLPIMAAPGVFLRAGFL